MPAEKPWAIVLGGTNPHIALIENLKARGYRVLLVDYLESPPAARVAHEHSRVSTLAMDEVLALARERKSELVIAACVDRANVTAAYVAERLELPAPYAFATAELVADKLRMKQELVRLGIPTAAFRVVGSPADASRVAMGFPVVAKPIDTGGSKGVRKASTVEELQLAIDEALKVTRSTQVLVEEYLHGEEVSADCVVQDGEPHILVLRKRYIQRGIGGAVLSAYATVSPAAISAAAQARIRLVTRDIARGFGLRTTPLLVQFMVDGDDVRVIEFAPRVGGGLNHRFVLLKTGVDIIDASVNAYLGRAMPLTDERRGGFLAANHVYTSAGRFGEVRNSDRLLEDGIVAEFYLHKARGAPISATMSSSDRVASFMVRADGESELLLKTSEAMQRLDVIDIDGNSMIRRDVYLKTL
jgi:biotin carboxylase